MKYCFCFLFVQLFACELLSQGVVVTTDHSDFLIVGIENPITVAAFNFRPSEISIVSNNGKFEGKNGHYLVRPDSVGIANIEIFKKTTKGAKHIASRRFIVKRYPDPVLALNNLTNGKIGKVIARLQIAPSAKWVEYYGLCAFGVITGFTVLITRNDQLLLIRRIYKRTGVRFSQDPELDRAIKSLEVNDHIVFTDITACLSDGSERHLQPAEFLITGQEE